MATKTTVKAKTGASKSTSAGRRRTSAKPSSQTTTATRPDPGPKSVTKPAYPDMAAAQGSAVTAATGGAASDPDGTASGETAPAEALRRPDLIEAIAGRVSFKRSDAKILFDVVLDEIGKALDRSDEVIVPPLGKLMVKKRMGKPAGALLTIKLKRSQSDDLARRDRTPLAEPDKRS